MSYRRDAINREISSLKKDLKGINPRLSTYAKIERRIEELRRELGKLDEKEAVAA